MNNKSTSVRLNLALTTEVEEAEEAAEAVAVGASRDLVALSKVELVVAPLDLSPRSLKKQNRLSRYYLRLSMN